MYQKYVACECHPDVGLHFVNEFLGQYPYYSEALVFKARMLIALSRDEEALEVLHTVKRIDERRIDYAFDEAEILYRFGRKFEAIQIIRSASEFLLKEALEGVENFLICIDFIGEEREEVFTMIHKEMIRFLSKDTNSLNLDESISLLQKHAIIAENTDTDEES